MSVFAGWPHEVPRVCVLMGGLPVFVFFFTELQPPSVCVLSVIRTSDSTPPRTFLHKTSRSVCVCLSCRLGHVLYLTHAAPRLTLPLVVLLPRSLQNPPGGKAFRVFAVIWEPQRAASPNRKSHLCCWKGGNQAMLSNSMTEMFLAFLHYTG